MCLIISDFLDYIFYLNKDSLGRNTTSSYEPLIDSNAFKSTYSKSPMKYKNTISEMMQIYVLTIPSKKKFASETVFQIYLSKMPLLEIFI